ncbi:MAG: HAD family phosphatase [Actinomycetales bacterium]|nr:HAD family phosphatase [Actinomycetales bacterium]
MSERTAIFLDFDGTYADGGVVPRGHVAAVRAARAAGHMVLLCTGRPKSMLSDHVLEAGFDGIVGAAGGYVEVADEVLLDTRFPAELAAAVLRVMDRYDVAYMLEAPEAVYGPPGVDRRLRAVLAGHFVDAPGGGGPRDILANLEMSDDLSGARFGKVTFFDSPVPSAVLAEEIGEGVALIASSIHGLGESAGEFYLPGVNKAGGMAAVAERFGLERRQLIAFGDGLNDVEMLRYAGIGVAIEGSHPDVVAAADRIAAGPEREGLLEAFNALGLT